MILFMIDTTSGHTSEKNWYYLASQLIKYDALEVIKCIISSPMDIHLKFLQHIKLEENFDALCQYFREIFDKIKVLCDDEEGDTYGAALIDFILSFNINVPDSNDQIVTRFYNLVKPKMGGKLKHSALCKQLICLAAGTCCHVINEKVPKHSKAIIEALEKSPKFYKQALCIFAKGLQIKLEFDNIADILPLIKPKPDISLFIYDKIRIDIKKNYPKYTNLLFQIGKSQCPELIACDEQFDPITRAQFIHRLVVEKNFTSLKTILTPKTYNVEVSDVVCELIISGYPSESVFKTCVTNREMISPTINSLTTNISKFYQNIYSLDLLGLFTSLFQFLLTYPDPAYQRQCITELQFQKIDAIAYLFLSDASPEMNSTALLLMQTSLELFAITHPNWEKMSFQSLPSYAFVAKNISGILSAKFFLTPEEMTDRSPKKTIYDASILLTPDVNRINYVCKLCSSQISQSIELRSAMESIFLNDCEKGFSPGKFAVIAAIGLTDITGMLDEALNNLDNTSIIGLASANERIRDTVLEKIANSKISPDNKIKVISFMVQRMLSSPKPPKVEHLQASLDILMSEYQTFTKGFDIHGQHDIPSSSLMFAFAADEILKHLPNPKRDQFEKLSDFIRITGINALKALSTNKSELKLPHHNLLTLRLYLTTLQLLLPFITEIQAKGAFKRAMILGDIQPCYSTLAECAPFFQEVAKIKPTLIEPMIMSIPVVTSIQNCILFVQLALTYFDLMQDKVFVLFLACIADSVSYINCKSIRDSLEGLSIDHMTFVDIPRDIPLTDYIYSVVSYLANDFVEASIKVFGSGIVNPVMQCIFDVVRPWVKDIRVLMNDTFVKIYGPIFPVQVNPELWKFPIRREIIRNTFPNYGDSSSVLCNAMSYCMDHGIMDETTWHAFLKVNPELCLSFVFAAMARGFYDESFDHVLTVSPHLLDNEAVYIIGSALMLNSTSIDVFRICYQQVISFYDKHKIEYDSSLSNGLHDHFSMTDSLFSQIIHTFPPEVRDKSLLTLLVFNDSSKLLYKSIKANKEQLSDDTKELYHRYTMACLSSGEKFPCNALINFFKILPDYVNPVMIVKELLASNDKDAAKAAINIIKITRKTTDDIDRLIALAIARGNIQIDDAKPFVYSQSGQALKFWCTDDEGEIDTQQLRAFISYPNESTISVVTRKVEKISAEVLNGAAPLIFAPDVIEFSSLMPFLMAIDREKIVYPAALAERIDDPGIPLDKKSLIGYFFTKI
ncbi:hypothetical protein TVAG_331350 [Trichomonas vaginalis G3]|uniref:Uncharacterized protein n=1 Tax=Trichomonas vaginalis (strain ATCC PRA-98 / G3) TaxID=412133 RepID=A2FRJ7_TRIV3|nr:hypothetical protein TVAGG3_1060950 [Trichomonas vaginalis G3]EAX92459.1 hypothetical protein TVAG_331350 [Trichomonas vaginalis G3]KAI5494682.1 hypothetical protein TVAGG3_1060950 [Trichomonas vaginalis G3]|eukprot:XP_001305389.1 hypothetical protein [Trichomonas vaginalis G3]